MKPATFLGRLARTLNRTETGRRAGLAVYRAFGALAARRLMTLSRVQSVYLSGSVAHGDPDLGYSDIDLVVIADLPSDAAERALLNSLAHEQERASPLGGLFYNLDCLDVRELPYARAFGGFWAMRLDAEGQRLAGEPLIFAPTARPPQIAAERFSSALRRWINTGARLLDPDVQNDLASNARDARRLAADIVGHAVAATVPVEAPPRAADVHAQLAHTFAALDVFAAHVSEPFSGSFRTTGSLPHFDVPESLRRLATTLIGGPVRGVALLARGARDVVPVVVMEDGVPPAEAIDEVRKRFASAREDLRELRSLVRRPVPLSPSMWRALALMEPAPFAGAAASSPLFVAGKVPPRPRLPKPGFSPRSFAPASWTASRSVADLRFDRSCRPRSASDNSRSGFRCSVPSTEPSRRASSTSRSPTRPHSRKCLDLRAEALRAFSAHYRKRLATLLGARNVR